ncbi:class I SAM-dependent methyltransferase [Olivibacter sp. SDN3]|uniref:class I SAM-dependent methyltransferase n=1 Tax=Olivibacter sp. SDN3 TaxID=2764720 RepID=UPI0016515B4A|nr:class I SAM-dependent methyltransferase [Olivibacter sp. SDN3]QNL51420.1 class I SAM-dependent methyltransferase [Olivibacter sp. SDN3]
MQTNKRLKPPIFSTRYVALNKLRDETLRMVKRLSVAKNHPLTLIDFGCGEKPYYDIINPLVDQYIGVDLSINPLADHHIDLDSKTTLPDQSADIILSNQVLEHVDSPEGYLKEAWRLLKPGGTLILSTHGYWYYHPTPNDYWRWTSAGLRKLIEEQHFDIDQFIGLLGLSASGLQLFQDALTNKLPKFLHGITAVVMQSMIYLFDKIHTQQQRNRDASIYVVFAKKAL